MAGSEAVEKTLDILTIAGYSNLNDRKGESKIRWWLRRNRLL